MFGGINPLAMLLQAGGQLGDIAPGTQGINPAAPAPSTAPASDQLRPELQEQAPGNIQVDRTLAPPAEYYNPYEDVSINNSEMIRRRDDALADGREAANRKGKFGVGGTLRDVLGVLGDAFLLQAGKDPLYRMTRDRENLSDAMAGYTIDPTAAIERVGGVDPAAAAELTKIYGTQVNNANTHQRGLLEQQRLGGKEARQQYETGMQLFGQVYGATDATSYERAKPLLQMIKERFQLGDEFSIGDTYDEGTASMYSRGSMPAYRQVTERQGDERIRQGDERIRQGDRRLDQNDTRIGYEGQRVQQGERRTRVAEQREARMSRDEAKKSPGLYRNSRGQSVLIDASGNERVISEEQAAAYAASQRNR